MQWVEKVAILASECKRQAQAGRCVRQTRLASANHQTFTPNHQRDTTRHRVLDKPYLKQAYQLKTQRAGTSHATEETRIASTSKQINSAGEGDKKAARS
jgi:hypothetical protein